MGTFHHWWLYTCPSPGNRVDISVALRGECFTIFTVVSLGVLIKLAVSGLVSWVESVPVTMVWVGLALPFLLRILFSSFCVLSAGTCACSTKQTNTLQSNAIKRCMVFWVRTLVKTGVFYF